MLSTLLEDGFTKSIQEKGEYFRKKLAEIPEVEGVDGMGLMIGVRLKTKKSGDMAKACLEKGLLVLTAKAKLRFLPPLTITYEEIDAGLKILAEVLA